MAQRSLPQKNPKAQQQLDTVFQAPLEEFVQARATAAEALRKKGQAAAAAEIKKLKKPTASAWAVNQLYFREPELWAKFVESGQALRHASESVQAEDLKRALHDAQKALQRNIDTLREKARRLLAQGGRTVAESTLNRIAKTLRALAIVTPSAELRAGRLSTDVEPPGLEALSSVWTAAPPSEAPASETKKTRQRPTRRKPAAQDGATPHKRAKVLAPQKEIGRLNKERDRSAEQRKRAEAVLAAQQRELDNRIHLTQEAARTEAAARRALKAAELASRKAERGEQAAREQVESARKALKKLGSARVPRAGAT